MIICCDIDGVLADVRPYVTKYLPHDWKTYFTHTEEFTVISPLHRVCVDLYSKGFDEIYFVTGRPESNRNATRKWLDRRILPGALFYYDGHILMRPNSDHRPTCEIKMEWFRELKPDLIIDDDPEVVKAATEEGFIVLQVHGFRTTSEDAIPKDYLEKS